MLIECKCGKEFITEADSHVVIPSPKGAVFNCGCFFSNEAQLEKAEKVIEFYGNGGSHIDGKYEYGEILITGTSSTFESSGHKARQYFQDKEQGDE